MVLKWHVKRTHSFDYNLLFINIQKYRKNGGASPSDPNRRISNRFRICTYVFTVHFPVNSERITTLIVINIIRNELTSGRCGLEDETPSAMYIFIFFFLVNIVHIIIIFVFVLQNEIEASALNNPCTTVEYMSFSLHSFRL